MKILINISSLTSPLSGVGRFTLELTDNLLKLDLIEDVMGFTSVSVKSKKELQLIVQQLRVDWQKPDLSQKYTINVLSRIKDLIKRIPLARNIRQLLQNRIIKKHTNKYSEYIYWEPNYILANFNGITIPTVYDLSHIRYPQFQQAERRNWLNKNLKKTLEDASQIISISEFSKQEIIKIFDVSPEKISIVTPAVSAEFRKKYQPLHIQEIKKKYNLPKNYILSVSNIEPRKNIIGLLDAYEQLSLQHKKDYPLVIIGAKAWLTSSIEKKIQQSKKNAHIIYLGYVSQTELPIIFQGASLFVYISLYEGFGMPIVEAMASAIPVICSNCGPMPAVANGCAKLVDPNNIKKISDTIASLLEDKTMQEKLIAKGLLISKSYTWEKSTEQLIEVLREVEDECQQGG